MARMTPTARYRRALLILDSGLSTGGEAEGVAHELAHAILLHCPITHVQYHVPKRAATSIQHEIETLALQHEGMFRLGIPPSLRRIASYSLDGIRALDPTWTVARILRGVAGVTLNRSDLEQFVRVVRTLAEVA